MKKSNLLLTVLLGFSLVSCSAKKDYSSFNINEWSPKLIDQNLNKDNLDNFINYEGYKKASFEKEEVFDDRYADLGILVIKLDEHKFGFYSLHKNDWLFEPFYSISFTKLSYRVYYDEYVLSIVRVEIDDLFYCYDGLGNEMYSKEKEHKGVSTIQSFDTIKCTIDGEVKIYDEYGVLKDGEEETINNLQVGDTFINYPTNNFYDVEIEGYKISKNSNFIFVYDKDDNLKTTYSLSSMLFGGIRNGYYYAGTSMIFQSSYAVVKDYEDYSYCIIKYNSQNEKSITKYVHKTYSLDLLTGKIKEIKLDYLLSGKGQVYKDKDGINNYSLNYLCFINKNKTIYEAGEFLLDENGKIIANATGFEPDKFIKLENGNYYNLETKVLYDSELNVITYLASIDPVYYKGIGFIGEIDGKYGVVKEDGIIGLPFIYSSIDKYVSNDYVFAGIDLDIYRINLKTFEITYFEEYTNVKKYDKGLCSIVVDLDTVICCASSDLFRSQDIKYINELKSSFSYEVVFKLLNTEKEEYIIL